MKVLRLFLILALAAYTLNVAELLHAMDSSAHGVEVAHDHSHDPGHEHRHDPQPSEAPEPVAEGGHWHCLNCTSGVQVLDQAPDLAPVAGPLQPVFFPPAFVPPAPSANIFHPPA